MKKLNMDIVVCSSENDIDMQYGLETLKGTSDVISIAAETILRERVPDKRTHRSDVRTRLKSTFKGSYGQKFSIEVEDRELRSRLRKIGDDTFLEIISYFVSEALYLDTPSLSKKASAVVKDLDVVSEKLLERLKEPLIEMHKISNYFDHDIQVRYRKRGVNPKPVLALDDNTARNITEAVKSDEETFMDVVIVRFHSITGNGRFYIKDLGTIESFSFESKLAIVTYQLKKTISQNLHDNNTVKPEDGSFIKVRVKSISLHSGKIIKYLISGIY